MRIAIMAALIVAATSGAIAQSARDVRGTSPFVPLVAEPPPKLIVDQPIQSELARGIVEIQYRTENVHIVPVFGKDALAASPRIGHLHITVDDLPWHWTDASDTNTIAIVGLPAGPHKVLIELADATHHIFPGQAVTVSFTVPGVPAHQH
jgi:uncharacterized protein DUF6130